MAVRTKAIVCFLATLAAAYGIAAAERQTEAHAVNLEEVEWGPPAGG